jgi:hypothetical protein
VTLAYANAGFRLGSADLATVTDFSGLWWFVFGFLVAVAIGAAVMWFKGGRPGAATLALMVPAGLVVAFASALRIRGAISPYLFAPDLAVGLIAWLVVGGAAAELLTRVAKRRAIIAALAAATAVVIATTTMISGSDAFKPAKESQGSPTTAELTSAVHRACASGRPVNLWSSSGVQWYDTVEVAAAIGECAPNISVDHQLSFIVGTARTKRFTSAPNLLLAPATLPPASTWSLLGHSTTLALYELPPSSG